MTTAPNLSGNFSGKGACWRLWRPDDAHVEVRPRREGFEIRDGEGQNDAILRIEDVLKWL